MRKRKKKLTSEQDVADIPQALLDNVHVEVSSLFPALQRVALHWLLAFYLQLSAERPFFCRQSEDIHLEC
jgi:hypothetical protein